MESRWVKVVHRPLPFMMNLATEGKTWQEQGTHRDQVLSLNQSITETFRELY